MQSRVARAAVAVGALVVAIALFVILSSGDGDGEKSASTARQETKREPASRTNERPRSPKVETITVKKGEPAGGVKQLEYENGQQVRFSVRSDVADEVHVHGYDLKKDVPAGGSVRFSFRATIEGVFEIELEGRKEQIAELRVSP